MCTLKVKNNYMHNIGESNDAIISEVKNHGFNNLSPIILTLYRMLKMNCIDSVEKGYLESNLLNVNQLSYHTCSIHFNGQGVYTAVKIPTVNDSETYTKTAGNKLVLSSLLKFYKYLNFKALTIL